MRGATDPAAPSGSSTPTLPVYTPGVYQIWNEENSQIAYAPKADPKEYAKLFELAAKRILQADPRVRVIPGGMFGTPQLEHSMYAWDFLTKFLKQPHMKAYIGGYAVHPYANGLRGVKYQVEKMRKAAHKAGFGHLPLYVTEIGYSSEKPNGNVFYKGKKGQPKAIKKTLGLLVRKQRKWHLKRVVWFTWSDLSHHASDVSGCGFCQKMGLVDKNLRPKPALKSWRHWALR